MFSAFIIIAVIIRPIESDRLCQNAGKRLSPSRVWIHSTIGQQTGENRPIHSGSSPPAGKPATATPGPESKQDSIQSDAGLTHRETRPVDVDAEIDAGDHPPADVWRELFDHAGIREGFLDAVRAFASGRTPADLLDALDEFDVPIHLRSKIDAVARGDVDRAWHLLAAVRTLGSGVTSIEDALTTARLFAASSSTPTVAVRIDEDFRDRRRDQREDTLTLLARLARGCEVSIVATGLTARWLAEEHREELPSSFSEQCKTRPDSAPPIEDLVEDARDRFDPEGRAVRILRDIAAEPGETLAYGGLTATHDVSQARVSQLLGDLEDADLVDRFGPRTDKRVELTPAGREFLDTLDREIGRQRRLDSQFSETGQNSNSDVLPRTHGRAAPAGPPGEEREGRTDSPYRTRYTGRADHAAAGGTATNGAIVAVEGPLPNADGPEERHTRYVSYDDDRDEVLVAVRATTPLQYMASVALALASPRLLDTALPVDRLDEIDDPPAILRDARCIGCLSEDAVEDAEILRDSLVEWGEDLADMTRKLRHGECENRDRFCSEILRSAHGLAGSIIHLLDVAGVDVIRELRVPSLADEDLAALAKTVAVATTIQSEYKHRTAYRQLFEDREDKRRSAFSVDVDATDPVGRYIGSLVVRGPSADRFGQHIEGRLSSPAPVHDDAPEFSVRVPVETAGRDAYTDAATRILATKNLTPTPEAVTMLDALAVDPYAVTEAIRWLGDEDATRRIRLDEVRVGLAALDADRLLPDAPPSVSKAVGVLLRSSRPLSQSELADMADISARSLRRHLDALVALDVVRETADGYRLALPFRDGEKGETILPAAVTDDLAARQDLLFDVALTLVDDAGRFGDPEDPVGAACMSVPPDLRALKTHIDGLTPWVDVAKALCNDPDPPPTAVEFGPTVEQTPLTPTATDARTADP